MAIIPLRAYNLEIEGLIDNNQLDEAVGHCRHILATFPKHLATYRLLGKAHLEQQRISDAVDIFQRVLSAIPDDFISNVGMSMIREDENNLDASIWHMELAYEAQPSNVAIQDELRRLYGRRDGMQPPKVRLTRGALARMYAKGGLYDQAIAELRAAIAEDPNRVDLQLLLAQMFFQTFQRVDAVDTCVNILKKLPLCLSANQILAVSLPDAANSEASRNYRQVAITMDPYFAFAEPDVVNSDKVPDEAVNIEKLEWKPGLQISDNTSQPSWATSLGVSLEKPVEEKLPDWLKEPESQAPAQPPAQPPEIPLPQVSPFIWDSKELNTASENAPKIEAKMPDWMKDAGWKQTTPEEAREMEQKNIEEPSSATSPDDDLVQADIPDWLRGIAPEGVLEEKPAGGEPERKDESLPWLEQKQPGPTDSIIQWLDEKQPDTPSSTPQAETKSIGPLDDEVPDWLKDLDSPMPGSSEVETPSVAKPAPQPEMPAFDEEPPVNETPEETPVAVTEEPSKPVAAAEITTPTQVPQEVPPTDQASTPAENSAILDEDLPDWLKELAGEIPEAGISEKPVEAQKIESPAPPEVPIDTVPEIIGENHAVETTAEVTEPAQVEVPIVPMEGKAESVIGPFTVPVEELSKPQEELPMVEQPTVVEPTAQAEIAVSEGKPVESADGESVVPTSSEPLMAEEGKPPLEIPAGAGEVVDLSRLEELRSEGGKLEGGITAPLNRPQGEPTEWVNLEAEASQQGTPPGEEPPSDQTPIVPVVEIPDWIKGLGEEPEPPAAVPELAAETTPETSANPPTELPAWLEGMEPPEAEKEGLGTPDHPLEWKEEEPPDWLKELSEEAPPVEMAAEPQATATEAVQVTPPLEWVPEESQITEPVSQKTEQPDEPSTSVLPPDAEVAQSAVNEGSPPDTEEPSGEMMEPGLKVETIPEQAGLEAAREAMNQGLPNRAVEVYSGLIKQNVQLDGVIKDIQDALYHYPVDIGLWVALGDAHLHQENLQEALNAYIKAEELVR